MLSSITRYTGLVSGLDVDKIVSDLMQAHRLQMESLEQKRQRLQWKREDYISINGD